MKLLLSLIVGKLIVLINRLLGLGSGSTWPGHIALKIEENFLKKIVGKNKNLKIIVVAGTNGKTTTTSLIKHIIKSFGFKVFSNPEGANLINGIASSFIKNTNLAGKVNYDYAVIETDEFSFPLLVKQVSPNAIIILNLFRDQLDRYGEVNTIGSRWFSSIEEIPKETLLIVNGDDPYLTFKSSKLLNKVVYFGVEDKLMKLKDLPHDVDFNYCPNCQTILDYNGISYAHLGNYFCRKCGFKRNNISRFNIKINYPLEGLYNIYNTNAAITLISEYLKLDLKKVNPILKTFKPAFGRQEKIIYKNRKIFLLLSKNPAGFNQSLNSIINILKNKKANFLVVINDRIPDGRDVSWIWDVDFQAIINKSKNIITSGDRLYDISLRFKYEGAKVTPINNLREAINKIISLTSTKETLFILPTYSAMLEIRKILVGRKLL